MFTPLSVLVIAVLAFAILILRKAGLGSKPAAPNEQVRKTEAERAAEKRSCHMCWPDQSQRFIDLFGFAPDVMLQDRYRKEMLMKLAFLAIELGEKAKQTREYPSIYRDEYDRLSCEYSDMLESVGDFDPEFQRRIPHWTELPGFVDGWMRGNKLGTERDTVTVET